MDICIYPSKLKGSLTPPISKSHAQRLILASGLALAPSGVTHSLASDIEVMLSAVQNLVSGDFSFDCHESGATLRFLMPVAMALNEKAVFYCEPTLFSRPMEPFFDELKRHGIGVEKKASPHALEDNPNSDCFAKATACDFSPSYILNGKLTAGEYILDGNISSQFVSGLLFALPLCKGSENMTESLIKVRCPVQSLPYILMTLEVLQDFGLRIDMNMPCDLASDELLSSVAREQGQTLRVADELLNKDQLPIYDNGFLEFRIPCGQKYVLPDFLKNADFSSLLDFAERDYSAASFWLCANALGSQISIKGLSSRSLQGDSAICSFLECLKSSHSNFAKNTVFSDCIEIDVSNTPDLVPPLVAACVALAFAHIPTNSAEVSQNIPFEPRNIKLIGCERLRYKESDRLSALYEEFTKLGANIEIESLEKDGFLTENLIIKPCGHLLGGIVDSHGDHRIAMALAIASTVCDSPMIIKNAQVVKKSYPTFFEDFKMLGGKIYEDYKL